MNQFSTFLLVLSAIFVLTACGGGDAERRTTPKVLVNAGQNIETNEQITVSVDGIATSTAGGITYAWTSTPALTFTLTDPTAAIAEATLTAPIVSQVTEYILTLTATDSNGTTGVDSITMRVNPVNIAPVAAILAPRIELYAIDTYPILTSVTLDGTGSTDADPMC